MTLKIENKFKITKNNNNPIIYMWMFVLVYLMLSETVVLEVLSNYNGHVTFAAILCCVFYEVWNGYRYSKQEFIFIIIIIILFLQSIFLGHLSLMAEIFFFLFVLRNVEKRKLVRITMYTMGMLIVVITLLCVLQVIPDAMFTVSGRLRMSLGFLYPSKIQTYLMLISFLWINAGFQTKRHIVGLMIINFFAICCFIVTDARYPFYIGFMASVVSGIMKILPWRVQNGELFIYFFALFMPILPFVMAIMYNSSVPWLVKLDDMLSGRLFLSLKAIHYRDLHFFNYMPNISSDAVTEGIYGFFDSGYLHILYNYGVYLYIIIVMLVLIAIRNALKQDDRQIVVTLIFMILYSMWYGHVISYLQYSIPILLCTYYISWKNLWGRFCG